MLDAMNFLSPLLLLVVAGCAGMHLAGGGAATQSGTEKSMTSIYSFTARDINGKDISLASFKGLDSTSSTVEGVTP